MSAKGDLYLYINIKIYDIPGMGFAGKGGDIREVVQKIMFGENLTVRTGHMSDLVS